MATEKRLIDANAFRQSLELDRFGYTNIVKVNIALDKSTVDAVEVVHGRWVVKGEDVFCSHCDKESGYNCWGASAFSSYCPNCGADMRGKTE